MSLHHAGLAVPQGLRDHEQRRPLHDPVRRVGVAEDVEADARLDPGGRAGDLHPPLLQARRPCPAVVAHSIGCSRSRPAHTAAKKAAACRSSGTCRGLPLLLVG